MKGHGGVTLWQNWVARSIIDSNPNQISEIQAVGRDVTDLKEIQDQLRQAQKMEVIGQLTGGVAHDFNNLLGIIKGNIEFLSDKIGSNSMLAAIDRAAGRGAELTQRLLAFARKQTLNPVPVDVYELVSRLIDLLRRTIGIEIELSVKCDEANLWPVYADIEQLENALLNLAINSRDAMPDGGRLEFRCANVQMRFDGEWADQDLPSGDYVEIAVSDSGSGMSAETLQHIFEPFFTTKDVGKGSGLGLAMVYGFVHQSGGGIRVQSELDKGTRIRIVLPRSSPEHRAAEETDKALVSGHGETILLLEDDPDMRSLVALSLESLGYEVIEAAMADDAIAIVDHNEHIDLILSDIRLPGGMNGVEFTRLAKERRPAIKILLMTGFNSDESDFDGEIGTILKKPFSRAELASAIRVALRGL